MSSNSENSLVIGFDIGNCSSEISLASTHGDIAPTLLHVYPENGNTSHIIPTAVKYDANNRLVASGREAAKLGYSNGELVENFKRALQLRYENQLSEPDEETEDSQHGIITREKAIKAFLDFIGYLKTLAKHHIDEDGLDYHLENAYFQFALPTSYCANRLSGLSLEDFRQIVISEESPFQEYSERLIIKEESEAAAIYCILDYLKRFQNEASRSEELIGQYILVWNAGYYDCELVTYRIDSLYPQIQVSQDNKAFSGHVPDLGSILIDNAFYEYLLEELPQEYRDGSWEGYLGTMASFRACKESFENRVENEETEVVVRLFPHDLPHSKNRDGCLAVSRATMRTFFKKTLPEALISNINQLFHDTQQSTSCIKLIFLIGGLGSSSVYEDEVKKIIHGISSAEIFKPAQPEAAICLGLVHSLLQELPRFTYDKSWGVIHPNAGMKEAKIDWFYDKGTILNNGSNSKFPLKYRIPMTKDEVYSSIHELKLVSYSGDIATRPNKTGEMRSLPTCILYIPLNEIQQPKSSSRQTINKWTKRPFDSQQATFRENDNVVEINADFLDGYLKLTLSEDSEEPAYSFVIGEYKDGNWTSRAI